MAEQATVLREFKKVPGFRFPVRFIHPKRGIRPEVTPSGEYTVIVTSTATGASETHVHHAIHEGEAWNIANTYTKPCHIVKLLNPKGEVRWISRHDKYPIAKVEPQLGMGL